MIPTRRTRFFAALLLLSFSAVCSAARLQSGEVRVWQTQEITFQAERDYPNPYTDVDVWIELKGPGFERRVYGFWDGGRTFKVRFVATAPGEWRWTSASNRSDDAGLNGGRGSVMGTISGALLMQVIRHGCRSLGVPTAYEQIIIGVIVIVAVTLDQVRQRRLAR